MSDKATPLSISNAELELTQKIQQHFPRGSIPKEVLSRWNSAPAEMLRSHLEATFGHFPKTDEKNVALYKEETKWRKENGVIYLPPLTTDGTTGEGWITRLGSKGIYLEDDARRVLRSPDFQPTKAGTVIEVAVLRGCLFENDDRTMKNICDYAEAFQTPDKRNLLKSNAELACLIREKFTDEEIEEMGLLRIIAVHELIKGFLLCARRHVVGRWLNACHGRPNGRWLRDSGFAFALSQVSSQS